MKLWAIIFSSAIHAGAFLILLGKPLVPSLSPIWIEQGGSPGVITSRLPKDPVRPAERNFEGQARAAVPAGGGGSTVHSTVEQWTSWGNAPPEYPYLAQKRGWEGKVEIRITITPERPSQVSLEHSSGHSILDEAALDWARQARVNVSQRTEYLVPIVFRMGSHD